MVKDAKLVDIYDDAAAYIIDIFMDLEEPRGNPFHHRWRINNYNSWISDDEKKARMKIDDFLKSLGLTDKNIIIITGSW
jgi:hypothetical protein